MAIWQRGRPRELLHHSDRGGQYTSEAFQWLMAEHGVTCSLSRSGNVIGAHIDDRRRTRQSN
jgi:putative transposase